MAKESREKFLRFLSPIAIVFQFFGIAPRSTPSKYRDIIHWIFQYLRIAAVTAIMIYNPDIVWESYEITSQVTLKILLLSYAVSVFEAIATRGRQLKIIKQLCRIDEIIRTEFSADFDNYSCMKKRYTWSIWRVFLGVVLVKIFHSVLFNRAPFVVCITWAYSHFGIAMRLLQNAFYVDMVYERLAILHVELNKLKRGCNKVQEQLNLAGDIYGKLWMLTNDINFSFGWSLLAITLELIVDLVNEANVMYSYCDSSECSNTTVSKCILNNISCEKIRPIF